MEVLRVDFKSPEALGSAANPTAGQARADRDGTSVWTRFLRQLTPQAPLTNRLLPKLKAGRLMLEVGAVPEWRHFDVALAGSSAADVGLYYYANKSDAMPLGCVRLHNAHIDVLEEVLMVVTTDKTWFLCAEHSRDASDWAEAICATIERVSQSSALAPPGASSFTRRRLSNTVSAATLREIASREPRTRVDEFLEIFVASRSDDVRLQALHGALSWSCMRNVVWKLWLEYLPSDVPLAHWAPSVRAKRQRYTALRQSHSLFADSLAGVQTDEDFNSSCETSDDALVYDIYKDVRRTRGAMAFFRDAAVQCLLVRVLYTYSAAHPEVSYNQGMGELLATMLYLLHIEQWPAANSATTQTESAATDSTASMSSSSSSFEKLSIGDASDIDDTSYVYVESCASTPSDTATVLDEDTLLKLTPFAGLGAAKYSECCRDAVERLVSEITSAEFLEHDAFGLLEELMVRMAGAFCPEPPVHTTSTQDVSVSSSPLSSLSSYVLGTETNGGDSDVEGRRTAASPLDDQMNRIHNHILRRCDPPLARHLSALGVEPQMFSLRWVRVLLSREFDLAHVWHVWDAIFSLTPSDFAFLNLLCVAAVREFRAEILAADDATTVLLCFRDLSDRVDAARLVDAARELYEALMIAAAVEASSPHAE